MKNIHVLPTDKPSRLYYNNNDQELQFCEVFRKSTPLKENQNIYITSDEEIKEGDWYLHFGTTQKGEKYSNICQCYNGTRMLEKASHRPNVLYTDGMFTSDCKKIILTTDQNLIKDGVQSIPDEFLEWFVKNPSCEEAEVKKEILYEHKDTYRSYPSECKNLTKTKVNYYLSILPKEEPKQCNICKMYPRLEGTNKCESCYSVVRHFLEQYSELKDNLLPDLRMKQETLEEAAKNHVENPNIIAKFSENKAMYKRMFQDGAKWQQERSYSEEEIYNLIQAGYSFCEKGKNREDVKNWFEQFKKK